MIYLFIFRKNKKEKKDLAVLSFRHYEMAYIFYSLKTTLIQNRINFLIFFEKKLKITKDVIKFLKISNYLFCELKKIILK